MNETARRSETDIALIGGGPVGALLACVLARRGFSVDAFERRDDQCTTDGAGGRSINLALSTRGLTTLKFLGLEEAVLKLAIPMRCRMIHAVAGVLTFQQYGKNDSEFINSSFAQAAGKVTDEILKKLCAGIDEPNQVDLKLAERLIKERLSPMLKKQPELAGML
jgi:hypothetical protein